MSYNKKHLGSLTFTVQFQSRKTRVSFTVQPLRDGDVEVQSVFSKTKTCCSFSFTTNSLDLTDVLMFLSTLNVSLKCRCSTFHSFYLLWLSFLAVPLRATIMETTAGDPLRLGSLISPLVFISVLLRSQRALLLGRWTFVSASFTGIASRAFVQFWAHRLQIW